jgi:hypothetical protein
VDLVITMVYINNNVNKAFFSVDIYIYICFDFANATAVLNLTSALINFWWGTLLNLVSDDVKCGRIVTYRGQSSLSYRLSGDVSEMNLRADLPKILLSSSRRSEPCMLIRNCEILDTRHEASQRGAAWREKPDRTA